MKAIILAGGKGTRLQPYTTVLPKPLMPLGEVPVLEVVIRRLLYFGIQDIVLTVGYLSELIRAYCDCSRYRSVLTYVKEDVPLGTIGPIASVEGLDDDFVVVNGDIVTTLDYQQMRQVHQDSQAIATVATMRRKVQIDFGVVETAPDGRIIAHREKPELEYQVGMGICFFSPKVLHYIRKGEYLDVPELLLRLIADQQRVQSYESDDYWLDVGRRDDYERAVADFPGLKAKLLPEVLL